MRISDWSSDVCSSDLSSSAGRSSSLSPMLRQVVEPVGDVGHMEIDMLRPVVAMAAFAAVVQPHGGHPQRLCRRQVARNILDRSEEHTSELQSLMRSSYAVFCLKKKANKITTHTHTHIHDTN